MWNKLIDSLLLLGIPKFINWIKTRKSVVFYGGLQKSHSPKEAMHEYIRVRDILIEFKKDNSDEEWQNWANSLIGSIDHIMKNLAPFDLVTLFVVNYRDHPLDELKVRIRNMYVESASYAKGPLYHALNPLKVNKIDNQYIINGFDQILSKQKIMIQVLAIFSGELLLMHTLLGGVSEIERYVEIIFKDGSAKFRRLKKIIWTPQKGVKVK